MGYVTRAQELERGWRFRERWIAELRMKAAECGDDGWPPNVFPLSRLQLTKWMPKYTPLSEYNAKIAELQKELGIPIDVPAVRGYSTLAYHLAGREIAEEFERIAG